MRVHHSNGNGTANSGHHPAHPIYANNDDPGSIGGRSGHIANIERIHQYQTGYTSGGGKQENTVLKHANGAHNAAHAHDPVVMNILKRTQAQRPIHPIEQKILDNRLRMNQKLLKGLEAHKHPANVSYELDVEQNGNSYVEKLRNGARVGRVPVSSPQDSAFLPRR